MIDVIYSPLHEKHNPVVYLWGGKQQNYIESPQRVHSILKELTAKDFVNVIQCEEYPDDLIKHVHDSFLIDFLKKNTKEVIKYNECSDIIIECDDAIHFSHDTYTAVKSSVDCALTGADNIALGRTDKVYCLCRPPGHHASRSKIGGFCFLNNSAIATKKLISHGKVAVIDIDKHHGNGTQDILFDENRVLYISLNAKDVYPSRLYGRQNPKIINDTIINYVVDPDASNEDYLSLIDEAIDKIKMAKSDLLVVSAGFDTSENEFYDLDGVRTVKLSRDCFYSIGKKIKDTKIPILVIQEGGYNIESLGKDVLAFLEGIE